MTREALSHLTNGVYPVASPLHFRADLQVPALSQHKLAAHQRLLHAEKDGSTPLHRPSRPRRNLYQAHASYVTDQAVNHLQYIRSDNGVAEAIAPFHFHPPHQT